MPRDFHPALRRSAFLSPELQCNLREALSVGTPALRAIIVKAQISSEHEDITPSMAPRFIIEAGTAGYVEVSWADIDASPQDALKIADAALGLMESKAFFEAIGKICADLRLAIDTHLISIMLTKHCIVITHDDPSDYIEMTGEYLSVEPQAEDLRSTVCTLVLPQETSSHARLAEVEHVTESLNIFRDTSREVLRYLNREHNLALKNPSALQLTRCKSMS